MQDFACRGVLMVLLAVAFRFMARKGVDSSRFFIWKMQRI